MRDATKSRVYKAERSVAWCDAALVREDNPAHIERWLRAVCARASLRKDLPGLRRLATTLTVRKSATADQVWAWRSRQYMAVAGYSRITIRVASIPRWVAIHELAHCISDDTHGREYRRNYVRLVRAVWGAAEARKLRLAFRDAKLPMREKRALSPERRAVLVARLAAIRATS